MPLDILEPKQKLKSLKDMLHQYSAPAATELIETFPNGDIKCYACGHRCLIKPGRDGVCRVRFNDNGVLKVPFNYVGCLACDPIEKKPFFHVLPGSDALTFGMLGCDFHCGYCFTPETVVATEQGPTTFADLFASAQRVQELADVMIAYPQGRSAVAGSGRLRAIEAVFKHHYRGPVTIIRSYCLGKIRCTPDHRVYATTDAQTPPEKIETKDLTAAHFLAVPRHHTFGSTDTIDVASELASHHTTYRIRWKLTATQRELVASATAAGESSRQIGLSLGKSASYIRHVRSKLARSAARDAKTTGLLVAREHVRFPHERGAGIPARIELNESLATLLGFYCAEGSVVRDKKRPNSFKMNFSFSHRELARAQKICELLKRCFDITACITWRATTLAACSGKTSLCLLFQSLAGVGAAGKRVPRQLFDAPQSVVRAFLDAYIDGDGHRYRNGKVSITTVSRDLAHGVAFLALKLGFLPSIYEANLTPQCTIQGRIVNRRPRQYTVVWYETPHPPLAKVKQRILETDDFHLIPLRGICTEDYDGDVFNMQVEHEHNYLANFLLVSNCQNWVTSQMLRDPDAVAPPKLTNPKQLVDIAIQQGAPVVASSYNEPLITSEWAVAVFKEARARNLKCAYISNGNGTPQVLDYIRPYVEAYKVDLKTFDPKHYRELGGVLENVMQTIRDLKARNFWVEIVTLVVPGFSDHPDDMKRMADYLASVDPLMPWHITAFHPDYKMTDGYRRTTVDDLMRIAQFGVDAGLKYIYPGNLPGQVGEWENTRCHHCNATVIKRYGFLVQQNRVNRDGTCPDCHKQLPGIWGKSSGHGDGRVRPIV